MTKDRKEYRKAYYKAHKEEHKARTKEWHAAHREEHNAYMKAWHAAHREERKAYMKAWRVAHREEAKAYIQADLNSLGQTKQSIRKKSLYILKQMNLHIDGYEIHHCFGYEDPSKFIYISKALHSKIHKYLRDNNIDASTDHWMLIRDIVNDTNEFTYIKS